MSTWVAIALVVLLIAGACTASFYALFQISHPSKPKKKVQPILLSEVYSDMWEARKKLAPEDQAWFDAVSNQAGIHMPVPERVPVRNQTLNLSGGTPTGQIIEVGDTKYQKFYTTGGFFYLKEVEGVTVRDMAGDVVEIL